MSYRGFKFKNFKEFQSAQYLAKAYGLITVEEFNNFLETKYSHLKG